MKMTNAQLATLKANIAANANTIPAGQSWSGAFVGLAINTLPYQTNADAAVAIAGWYNQVATPNFFGNYSSVPLTDIKNAVAYKNFTPVDPVPVADVLSATIHMARTTLAAAFAMNLNNLLLGGSGTLDCTKPNIVQGLKDTLNTGMPTGANGNPLDGGWNVVKTVICRLGTFLEKVFADISGGSGADNGHAATFVLEGAIDYQTVQAAGNS